MKKLCKYCKNELQEFDCYTLHSDYKSTKNKFLQLLLDIFMIIETPFFYLLSSLNKEVTNDKVKKSGKITTCLNKNCIGYLDGCYGKNKGAYL